MKSYRLRSRIIKLAAVPLILIVGTLGWHLVEHRSLELEQAHFNQLDQLTISVVDLLSQSQSNDRTATNELYRAYSNALLSSKLIRSVTILNPDYKVLSHQGESLTTRLNPNTFPKDRPQLFEVQGQPVFVVPFFISVVVKKPP